MTMRISPSNAWQLRQPAVAYGRDIAAQAKLGTQGTTCQLAMQDAAGLGLLHMAHNRALQMQQNDKPPCTYKPTLINILYIDSTPFAALEVLQPSIRCPYKALSA